MDDLVQEEELTTVKEEMAFMKLSPELTEVTFRDDMYPISINLIGDITATTASEFETKFFEAQRSGQKQLAVILQSEGGSCYDALKIVDLLLTSDMEIVTCIRGYAFSAASLIFSCGAKRVIGPNASVMIHSVSVDSFGGTMAEMIVESNEMGRINDRMCELMAENTGKRKDFYKKKLKGNRDIYLTAEEALKMGLATNIGDVRLETTIQVQTELCILPSKKRKR
jgi:ATP-dependent Clp endopeptidase proteolytic subunit ClpP